MNNSPFLFGPCPVCESPYLIYLRDVAGQRTKLPIALKCCLHCLSFTCAHGYKEDERQLQLDTDYNVRVMAEKEPYLRAFVAEMVRRFPIETTNYADIGCSVGQLVNLFPYPNKVGYDVNRYAISKGLELFPHLALVPRGVNWRLSFEKVGFFNFATLIDVVEHIAEPLPFLRKILYSLAPNGALYVTVPRIDENLWPFLNESYRDQEEKKQPPDSPFRDNDVHVTHFSTKGLSELRDHLPIRSVENFTGPWPLNGVLLTK